MFFLWFALPFFCGRTRCRATEIVPFEFNRSRWGSMRRHNAVGVIWRWKKWKQLVFAKNRGIYMSCFLTWLRINYDTWTYERLSFTKAFKLVLWTQSCPKEMLVRSYCPSETCLTSSSGTQWSPLIGPMGPMLIYFNRDVENYTLGRRCWWVFWSK